MKNLKLILLLQAFVFGTLTVNADDDCCPDGNPPAFDCEDGGDPVCDSGDCPPCSTHNPDPSSSEYICCGGQEYLKADYCCSDDDEPIEKDHPHGVPADLTQGETELSELPDRSVSDTYVNVSGNPFIGYLYNYYDYSANETDRKTLRKIENVNDDPYISNCGGDLSSKTYSDSNYSYSFNPSVTYSGVTLNFSVIYEPSALSLGVDQVDNDDNYKKIYQDIFKTSKKGKSSHMTSQAVEYNVYEGGGPYPSRNNHKFGPFNESYEDETKNHSSSYSIVNYESEEDEVDCCPGT